MFFDIMDFRISFAKLIMRTIDQIVIEELRHIIQMQSQENKLLKARIADLERKVEQLTIRKNSNNSSHARVAFERKAVVRLEAKQDTKEKHWG